ncbi:MAG: CaiB/BaiF CoA transferase family protein [Acidimicrobiales bacterium]
MTTGNPHPTKLLKGVRVLDFTQYLAGPTCTRLLVELGADVFKVEFPPAGDPSRPIEPMSAGMSSLFIQQNRGKRSICLDLRHPEAPEVIRRLIPTIDVVVENFTPGVLAKYGLSYQDLAAINPGLIMASVSGFGQEGSFSHRPCFDFIAQGMAGIMHMTGEPDGPPYFAGLGIGDVAAGVHAFAGVGFALYQRDRTGHGTHLDVSMVDALFHMQEHAVGAASMTDGDFVPGRHGRHYLPVSPAGTFKAPQGWIVILCMPNQIDGLWAAIDDPAVTNDPRFVTAEGRQSNREALTDVIETWMSSFQTDDEVLGRLEEHHVPSGPVLSPSDAIDHPWFIERGAIRQVDDGAGGSFAIPGFPIRFDRTKPDADLTAPQFGEYTRSLLSEAGFSATEIDDLVTKGALSMPHLG